MCFSVYSSSDAITVLNMLTKIEVFTTPLMLDDSCIYWCCADVRSERRSHVDYS